MASTHYPVNHPLAVKLWAKKLFREALKSTAFNQFIGKDSSSVIERRDEFKKSKGDHVTFGLRMQLSGDGVEGDSTLEGQEESLTTYSDGLYINQLRHAVTSEGKMSEQRVHHNVREEARQGLQDWFADRIDQVIANHLAGNTKVKDGRYKGHNNIITFDDKHVVFPGGAANEAEVATKKDDAKFTLDIIDKCVTKAKTIDPMIRPIMHNGNKCYVMFLHPYQIESLRKNTSSGQWLDIQKAAMQGGNVKENPIFSGALGKYNNVYLFECVRLPEVVPTVRRAVFCGAQAGVIAFGGNSGPDSINWVEKLFDYGNKLGVSAGLIWGMKKTRFNNQDFGTITVPTYAVE